MRIGIIGAGNMGGAIARGLSSCSNIQITVSNPSEGKLTALHTQCPDIKTTDSNISAVEGANVVILAVKPWILPDVIRQIMPHIDTQTIVSLAGGISFKELIAMIGSHKCPTLLRAIPTTAISVNDGLTFISSHNASTAQVDQVREIFDLLGKTAVIDEGHIEAATALCSCGIAYVFKFMQAYVQAGVQIGFRPSEALQYVNQTILGASSLISANGTTPQQEIDKVTTPGGMTIKGINELEHTGFTSSVIKAILAPLCK